MKIYYSLAFLFVYLNANAQEYVITTQHWDVKEGLNHRDVLRVFQDKAGYIWVWTKEGLNRFDGYDFKWYPQVKDKLPAINNWVATDNLTEDSLGNLWFVSMADGLTILNTVTGSVSSYKPPTGISEAKKGWHLSRITDSIKIVDNNSNLYYYLSGNQLTAHQIIHVDSGSRFLYFTEKNTCWLLKNNQELIEVDLAGNVIKKDTFPTTISNHYRYVPGTGAIFKNGVAGPVYFADTNLKITDISSKAPPYDGSIFDEFYCTGLPDVIWRNTKLWSLQTGLIRDFINERELWPEDNFKSYRVNKEQLLIATNFGFYRILISRNKFRQFDYNSKQVLYNGKSYRGLTMVDSSLFAVNEKNGVYKFNIRTREKQDNKILPFTNNDFFSITKSNNGNLFFARRDTIYQIDINRKLIGIYSLPDSMCRTWSVFEISPGKLLVGTECGLKWVNTSTHSYESFTQYNGFNDLARSLVLDISSDRSGIIWLCTNTGFYQFDEQKGILQCYSSKGKGSSYLPAKNIQHFCRDSSGVFWLATSDGLLRWNKDSGTSRLYTRENGLSNNNIYGVFADKYNRLWLSSDYGIMKFDKVSSHISTYLTEDGITYNEFNRKSHFQDPAGNIYFGSMNGITSFNPTDFPLSEKNDKAGAPLVITSFLQFDGAKNMLKDRTADLIATNMITMGTDDRFFTIEFALLNYSNSRSTTYYWRIDDLDTGWNVQKDRNIRLSRLPYGSKQLHILAQAADGGWSRNELVITIDVLKPVYLKNWFLISCGLTLISLSIGGYQWRVALLKSENLRLDRIIQEKTSDLTQSLQQKEMLLKEIHHRVKNNLQIICSLLRLQSGKQDDPDVKNVLLESQNRVLTMALIHQKLYQNEDLAEVEIGKFSSELFNHLRKAFHTQTKDVTLINNIFQLNFDIDIAVPLGLILNELMTNSLKYAFSNNDKPLIQLDIVKNGNTYALEYFDNGKGLPPGVDFANSETLGLNLVNRLSSQLKGQAAYHFQNGSRFIITFEI